jgi:Domain of unknown function (DUF4410)
LIALLVLPLFISACSTLHVEDEQEIHAARATAPAVVYVKDFDLRSQNFEAESGILPVTPTAFGGPTALIPRVLGIPEENAMRERDLVNLMSSALVENLQIAGLNARHLPIGETFPSKGWLVRGAFMQVDEGNRLRRALVGFGSGATRLRVVVWVSDLSNHSPGPFYVLDTSTHSSRKPGAVFSFDPYIGIARFLTDGLDMETNVTQIATEIADDISERSRTGEAYEDWKEKLKGLL